MAIVPTYQNDVIIGPDGTAFPRGDGTTVTYNWTTPADPNTAATHTAGAGTNYDAAWFQYAIEQYPQGGTFKVLSNASDGLAYFANDADNVWCNITTAGVSLEIATDALFKFNPSTIGPTSMFKVVGARRFRVTGGRFVKQGDQVKASQSFFALSDNAGTNCDYSLFDNVYFETVVTSTALQNFACIRLSGFASGDWYSRMIMPTVRNCTHRARDVQQATALGALLNADGQHSDTHYGAFLLRSENTSGLRVLDCMTWGQDTSTTNSLTGCTWTEGTLTITKTGGFATYQHTAGDTCSITAGTGATVGTYEIASKTDADNIVLTTSIGAGADGQTDIEGTFGNLFDDSHWVGGHIWVENDEGGIYRGSVIFGVDTMATDGTGGTLFKLGTGNSLGEGSHYVLTDITAHSLNTRYLIDLMNPLYCVLGDMQFGRMWVDAIMHFGEAGDEAIGFGGGDGVTIGDIQFHNINRALYYTNGKTGVQTSSVQPQEDYHGYAMWFRCGKAFLVNPINYALWSNERIIMRVEEAVKESLFLNDTSVVSWKPNVPEQEVFDIVSSGSMVRTRQRSHFDDPGVWKGSF